MKGLGEGWGEKEHDKGGGVRGSDKKRKMEEREV